MLDFVSPDPVHLQARLRPDATACVELRDGRRWSYAEFDREIARVAVELTDQGVARGERVAVLARNSVWQIILQMALMRLGAIFVPLNWRLSGPEVAALLVDCDPKILFFDDVQPVPPGPWRTRPLAELASGEEGVLTPAAPSHAAGDPCTILYTSGTSGRPKGVLLTPTFLLATAVNFGLLGEVDSKSVFLCDTPMFHVIGLVTQVWSPLLKGGTVLVSDGFDPERTGRRLSDPDLAVTHYFCVPQMAEAIRHSQGFDPKGWTSLKAIFTGGAPNPPASIRWWLAQGVAMVDGYGMTEAGTVLGMPIAAGQVDRKAGAVGLCGPLTRIRIVDDAGSDAGTGRPGEILVGGMGVTPGYWNRPQERESAFTQDGWYRTGDIGRADEDGFVTIVDRKKDMFISGGENVYPVEIEAALLDLPAVREAAVIGVPDDRWGEVGRAYVVLDGRGDPDEQALRRLLSERIARYKLPKEIRFVASLPRTPSGKIMKHVLRRPEVD